MSNPIKNSEMMNADLHDEQSQHSPGTVNTNSRPVRQIRQTRLMADYNEYRQTLDEGRPSAQRRKIERKQGQNGPLKKDGHDKSKKKTKRTVASNIISDMGTPKKSYEPVHKENKPKKNRDDIEDLKSFDLNTNLNHDICDACGDGGDLLCCDNCPCTFHFNCINPPMDPDNLPEEDWYCASCNYSLGRTIGRRASGKLAPILDLINSLNPKEFYIPHSIMKGSNSYDVRGEFRTMDILELITIPTTAAYRYIVDEKSSLKKRKSNTCSVCNSEGDDMIRCSQCKKLFHRWCIEPFCHERDDDWVCKDHQPREMAQINLKGKPKLNSPTKIYEEENLLEEPISIEFNRTKLPDYLQTKIEEPIFTPGKYDSDDEFLLESKRSRPKRSLEPAPSVSDESKKIQPKPAVPLKPKSKSYVNIQSMDPRTKTWCLKKLKIEQNMLTNQLVEFSEYYKASEVEKSEKLNILKNFQSSIPREYTALTEENSFSSIIKNLDRHYLIEYKQFLDEGSIRNELSPDMIQFLAYQRLNQLLMQNTLQLHFPHKPKKSEKIKERRASAEISKRVLEQLRDMKTIDDDTDDIAEWLSTHKELESKKRDNLSISSEYQSKNKRLKRGDSIEENDIKDEKSESPPTNTKKLKFKMSTDKVYVCYLNDKQ